MYSSRTWIAAAVMLLTIPVLCVGDEPEPTKFYKLDFVIKEVEGTKSLNSRAYSIIASPSGPNQIRVGSKIPYVTGGMSGPGQTYATTQVQQFDVGVNIDVRAVKEIQNRLAFSIVAEFSSVARDPSAPNSTPIVRQNKWTSTVAVPFKKPTVVFSSDTVDGKSQMQVEVTASPVP